MCHVSNLASRPDASNRRKRAEGHLCAIIAMIAAGWPCIGGAQPLQGRSVQPPPRPEGKASGNFRQCSSRLDPEWAAKGVATSAEDKGGRLDWTVTGMDCASCATRITTALTRLSCRLCLRSSKPAA